jgi:hypothetical protein
MIVPSFDGHIYVIEGHMRCAERIDIGEHIYSVPLIDDVTEDGYLDLVVGTLNGQVHLLETKIPYHPLNTWPSFPKRRLNGFTHGVMGVSFPLEEKRLLARADVINRGKRHIEVEKTAPEGGAKAEVTISHGLSVTFDIWDTRDKQIDVRKYRVTFSR